MMLVLTTGNSEKDIYTPEKWKISIYLVKKIKKYNNIVF